MAKIMVEHLILKESKVVGDYFILGNADAQGNRYKIPINKVWNNEIFVSDFVASNSIIDYTSTFQDAVNYIANVGGRLIIDIQDMLISDVITIPSTTKNFIIDGDSKRVIVSSTNGFITNLGDIALFVLKNINIICQGGEGNVIKLIDTNESGISPQHCIIIKVHITGFNITSSSTAFLIEGGVANTIQNCSTSYCSNAFVIKSAQNTKFINCNFSTGVGNGLYVYGCENIVFRDGTIQDFGNNLTFFAQGNTNYETYRSNILIVASNQVSIVGTKIKNAKGHDISIIESKAISISENWIRPDHIQDSIFSKWCKSIFISKNLFAYAINSVSSYVINVNMSLGDYNCSNINITDNDFAISNNANFNSVINVSSDYGISSIFIEKNNFYNQAIGLVFNNYVNIEAPNVNNFSIKDNKFPYDKLNHTFDSLVRVVGVLKGYNLINDIVRYNNPLDFNYYKINGVILESNIETSVSIFEDCITVTAANSGLANSSAIAAGVPVGHPYKWNDGSAIFLMFVS